MTLDVLPAPFGEVQGDGVDLRIDLRHPRHGGFQQFRGADLALRNQACQPDRIVFAIILEVHGASLLSFPPTDHAHAKEPTDLVVAGAVKSTAAKRALVAESRPLRLRSPALRKPRS